MDRLNLSQTGERSAAWLCSSNGTDNCNWYDEWAVVLTALSARRYSPQRERDGVLL
jgi:hypothetical protein